MTLNLAGDSSKELSLVGPAGQHVCLAIHSPAMELLVGDRTPRWSLATENPNHAHFIESSSAFQAGLLPGDPALQRCPGAHRAASRGSYRRWEESPEGLTVPY